MIRYLAGLVMFSTCVQGIAASTPQQQFWQALAQHCGKAYAGVLAVRRTDRPDILAGDEQLIVHIALQNQQQELNHARWITTSTR